MTAATARNTLLLLAATFLITACSTSNVTLRYPSANVAAPGGLRTQVGVGTFLDDRGVDARWLGAVRGGYGNVLKRLRTDEPMQSVVEQAFRDALDVRGLLSADAAPEYELRGRIQKLDCSQYFSREAHAHLTVSLFHVPTSTQVFSSEYRADNSEGAGGVGVFGSTEGLRQLAETTLNQAIDQALTDRALLAGLERPTGIPGASTGGSDTASRLRELEELRAEGLISEREYREKRRGILEGL